MRRRWRVHQLAAAAGLSLRDVWEVETMLPAGTTLEQWLAAFRRERPSLGARALFGIRRALGASLRLDPGSAGLVPVYAGADEQLLSLDNRTVSAFLHISLAERRPRLAIYVKPKGWLGRAYLWAIEPFRRRIVYPSLLAAGGRAAARLQAEKP